MPAARRPRRWAATTFTLHVAIRRPRRALDRRHVAGGRVPAAPSTSPAMDALWRHALRPADMTRSDTPGRSARHCGPRTEGHHGMTYDLIVIGTGPGGYVCAIRAAQLGLKTAVVEKDKTFGGTCLNVGCIPSKALLHASELFEEAGAQLRQDGHQGRRRPTLDLPAMMKFKDEGVDGNVKGVAYLLKKNKIDAFQGVGRIAAPGKVEVTAADGKNQTLETKSDRHRDRLGRGAPQGHHDRREAHRVVDRRAGAAEGAGEAPGGRRRRHRARARLGVAAARRAGPGGRVPRPHPARHGPRRREAASSASCRSRASRSSSSSKVTAIDSSGREAQGEHRAGGGRHRRDRRGRRGADRGRPRALHGRARARRGRASSSTTAGASRSMRISPPMCRASTRSAT